LDKGALGLEKRDVALERHLSAGYGADDQVKSAAVVLCPVLVVIGSDVSVGTELENLVLLACLARNTDDLVGSKSLSKQDTEVAETTYANNTDLRYVRLCLWYPRAFQSYLLARSSTIVLQWRVDGDTTTKHGSSLSTVETVGNIKDEVAGMTSIGSVATITLAGAILVLVAVCVGNVQTVVLFAILAVLALAAAVRLSADTDCRGFSDCTVEDQCSERAYLCRRP